MVPHARFYTRPGCHLCEQAWPGIARLAEEGLILLERVDISGDAELEAAYGLRIPVVELSTGAVFEPPLSGWRVREALGEGGNA